MSHPRNEPPGPEAGAGTGKGDAPPEPLANVPRDRMEDLDVREQLRGGGEPFERIMGAVSALPPGGVLRLRVIFEPVPLYAVMQGRGFRHWTECLGPEDWRVWFWRPGGPPPRGTEDESERLDERGEAMSAEQGPYLLDVRKLEGPDKHPTIHRMFDRLAPGQTLTIVNDHEPRPLFYELKAERPDRFDAENYRAYQADARVWVAVLPTSPDGSAAPAPPGPAGG